MDEKHVPETEIRSAGKTPLQHAENIRQKCMELNKAIVEAALDRRLVVEIDMHEVSAIGGGYPTVHPRVMLQLWGKPDA